MYSFTAGVAGGRRGSTQVTWERNPNVEKNSCAGKWKDGKPTMKQESEEKTIKELFQRLKQEDERGASSFARVI